MKKNKTNTIIIDVADVINIANSIKASDYPKVYQITYTIKKRNILNRVSTWVKGLFK